MAAASALADSSNYVDPSGDSIAGDSSDIVKAADGHFGAKFKHVITVADADSFTRRHTFLFITSEGTNYVVRSNGVFQGASMVGDASSARDGNKIIIKFNPAAIGDPSERYRWRAFEAAPDHEPFDQAPDSGRYIHALVGG